MRLFIALPLPAEIASAAAALTPVLPGLRPVKPELLHVTLAFIGRVPDERLADVIDATRAAAARLTAFDVSLASAGRFPEGGRPHVVWIGMTDGAAESAELSAGVRRELAARELPFDDKPFRPHVTLARVKDDVDRPEARDIATAAAKLVFAPLRWTAREVIPFESVLSPKGPRYTARATVTFGDRVDR